MFGLIIVGILSLISYVAYKKVVATKPKITDIVKKTLSSTEASQTASDAAEKALAAIEVSEQVAVAKAIAEEEKAKAEEAAAQAIIDAANAAEEEKRAADAEASRLLAEAAAAAERAAILAQQEAEAEAARIKAQQELEAAAEAARIAEAQRLEAERLEAERLEAQRLEAERAEAKRIADEEAARLAEIEAAELKIKQADAEVQSRIDELKQHALKLFTTKINYQTYTPSDPSIIDKYPGYTFYRGLLPGDKNYIHVPTSGMQTLDAAIKKCWGMPDCGGINENRSTRVANLPPPTNWYLRSYSRTRPDMGFYKKNGLLLSHQKNYYN